MEVAAENLRQLAKSVEQQSKLSQLEAILAALRAKAEATFGHADRRQEDIGGETHPIPHGHRHMEIFHDWLMRGYGRTRAASQNQI